MKKFIWIAILIVFIDQVSKFFLTGVHKGIINYTTNTGAAFSILTGFNNLLMIVATIVAVFVFIFAKNYKIYRLPLAFILGGIIGNLIDRMFFGFVRDFIDFKVWPIFNIADSFNVIGVVLLIILLFKAKDLK
ncbi:MAG: signal peptidase II [Nanoarchaeota archaeon]|nr:signal peptidase II [Nanoarchaeota archaeon]MBU1444740.1 signal peptidase II [Nanoarchaeota archaeon]MBU2420764.1 signal peptidase II [Nanoarchaeota archaeon]MBU2475155.1 signal peptidase II [Nanoarchaeota archaeon]